MSSVTAPVLSRKAERSWTILESSRTRVTRMRPRYTSGLGPPASRIASLSRMPGVWPTSPSTHTFPRTVTVRSRGGVTSWTVTESPGAMGTSGASPFTNWSAPTAITTRARPDPSLEDGGSMRWMVTRAWAAPGSNPPAKWSASRRVSFGFSSYTAGRFTLPASLARPPCTGTNTTSPAWSLTPEGLMPRVR